MINILEYNLIVFDQRCSACRIPMAVRSKVLKQVGYKNLLCGKCKKEEKT